jgi:uncharacterized delta-60 repeat protein
LPRQQVVISSSIGYAEEKFHPLCPCRRTLIMNIRPLRLSALCSILFAALFAENAAAAVTLDPDFGEDGRVAVELGIYGSRANAVLAQPDGKILVAGSSTSTADKDFMLFRLLPDGELDKNFNYDGTVTTPVGSYDDEALTLALQEDGKILAGGYTNNGENRDFALVRYNSDGSLDRDFGLEGMAVTQVGSSNDEITDMAVQKDGSIVVTGAAQGKNGRVVALARYKADGVLDTSFAKDGFSLSVTGVDAQAESVALSDSGRILVSGSYSDGKKRGLMLLGFDAAGQLDKTFGENGIAVPADGSAFSEGYGMLLTEDKKVLVAGAVGEEGQRDAALFQFTAEGQPDSSFEKNGVLVAAAGENDDVLYDVTAVGEKVAAAGFKTVDEKRVFLLITYTKGGSADADNLSSSSVTMQDGEAATESGDTEALATIFSDDDKSTALSAVSNDSVVTVGESTNSAGSSAAVSKYLTDRAAGADAGTGSMLDTGSPYLRTFEPGDVTRTTAILSGTVSELSNVTEVGFVFSTMPNPTKEGSSAADSSGAPTVTNTSASSISGTSATLSLTTDVDAICKYDTDAGTAYDDMADTFTTTGEKIHAQILSDLEAGTHTYYARCKGTSSGVATSVDTTISFTVKSSSNGTEDTEPPKITNDTEDSFSLGESVTLTVETNEQAECKYKKDSDADYETMTGTMSADSDDRKHSDDLGSSLSADDYTFFVRCKDSSGNTNASGKEIKFSVGSTPPPPSSGSAEVRFQPAINTALQSVGSFFVSTAYAQTTPTDTSSTTTTTSSNTAASTSTASNSSSSASASTASASGDNSKADTKDDNFFEDGYITAGSGLGSFSSKLKDLKPGTFFYVRAYAISNGSIYYGNQVGFRTGDSCFVATAAFGSIFAPAVQTLRDFRDQFLSGNAAARALVDFYYQVSPSIADVISQHSALRFAVRMLLLPVTGAAWLALQIGLWMLLLPTAALLLLGGWQGLRRRRQSVAA